MSTPHHIEPLDTIRGPGRTLGADEAMFVIESPIESPRDAVWFLARLGLIEVAGEVWQPTGTCMYKPAMPIRIGEHIMVRCRRATASPSP